MLRVILRLLRGPPVPLTAAAQVHQPLQYEELPLAFQGCTAYYLCDMALGSGARQSPWACVLQTAADLPGISRVTMQCAQRPPHPYASCAPTLD